MDKFLIRVSQEFFSSAKILIGQGMCNQVCIYSYGHIEQVDYPKIG